MLRLSLTTHMQRESRPLFERKPEAKLESAMMPFLLFLSEMVHQSQRAKAKWQPEVPVRCLLPPLHLLSRGLSHLDPELTYRLDELARQ